MGIFSELPWFKTLDGAPGCPGCGKPLEVTLTAGRELDSYQFILECPPCHLAVMYHMPAVTVVQYPGKELDLIGIVLNTMRGRLNDQCVRKRKEQVTESLRQRLGGHLLDHMNDGCYPPDVDGWQYPAITKERV